jgi:hypothetical protein
LYRVEKSSNINRHPEMSGGFLFWLLTILKSMI